jgi:type I restriction enzyme M protein
MVQVTDPKIGEQVLDPACGTGGFLTEAFAHMAKQANTVKLRDALQSASIFGGEAKSLPFLLAQLNLLLHGLNAPQIAPDNSLKVRLAEIGEAERVNVILTNPPFGGEEETGILNNFPEDRRTSETALLFLQMIMRRLKRRGKGRAAVVVPHGVLFGDGIAARIKADLIRDFNLHTIIRLPEGVFAPYTDIPTNILFFDTRSSTGDIWFYEQPRPEGRKRYSKTAPLTFEELTPCLEWWNARKETNQAWKIRGLDLIEVNGSGEAIACNLDQKNPNAGGIVDHRSPMEILENIQFNEQKILGITDDIRRILAELTR